MHSKNDNNNSFEHAEYAHKWIINSKLIGLDNERGHLFWIGEDANDLIKQVIAFREE